MDYSKATCKSLPQDKKDYFLSSKVRDLARAAEVCKRCNIQGECLEEGQSSWKNNGVWGGKILSRGVPVSSGVIQARLRSKGKIKFYWHS
jgi:hypothetical protein